MSGKNGSAVKTRTTRDQDGDGIIRICEYELGEVHGPRIFCDSVREGLTQHARVDVCRETNKAVDSCTQPRIIDKAKPDVVTPDQGRGGSWMQRSTLRSSRLSEVAAPSRHFPLPSTRCSLKSPNP